MIIGRKPKVLIGVPTYAGKNYCLTEFIEGLWLLNTDGFDVRVLIVDNTDDGGKNAKYIEELSGFTVHHLDCSRCEYVNQKLEWSHNYLREAALKMNADYLFHIESDLVLPPNALHELYVTNEQIVSGCYSLNTGAARVPIPHIASDMLRNHPARGQIMLSPTLLWRQFVKSGKQEVSLAGVGVMLIHRNVLRDVPFRSEKFSDFAPDSYWSTDVNQRGYKIFVNNDVYAYHMNDTGWGAEIGFITNKSINYTYG